jgi:hypothetical protein
MVFCANKWQALDSGPQRERETRGSGRADVSAVALAKEEARTLPTPGAGRVWLRTLDRNGVVGASDVTYSPPRTDAGEPLFLSQNEFQIRVPHRFCFT